MLIHPIKKPNEATELRVLRFTPPHKPIIQKRIPVNPAVLKLGCSIINRINNPNVVNEIIFFLFLTKFQCANKFAASKIAKGLINSDGCICKGPRINHLCEPLIVLPIKIVNIINPIKK